jgi:hypothetical protein
VVRGGVGREETERILAGEQPTGLDLGKLQSEVTPEAVQEWRSQHPDLWREAAVQPGAGVTVGVTGPNATNSSGRPDSNRRPSVPQTDALTRLRHAPLLVTDGHNPSRPSAFMFGQIRFGHT